MKLPRETAGFDPMMIKHCVRSTSGNGWMNGKPYRRFRGHANLLLQSCEPVWNKLRDPSPCKKAASQDQAAAG